MTSDLHIWHSGSTRPGQVQTSRSLVKVQGHRGNLQEKKHFRLCVYVTRRETETSTWSAKTEQNLKL